MKPSAATFLISIIIVFSSFFILFAAFELFSVIKLKYNSNVTQGIIISVQEKSNTEMDGIGYEIEYPVDNKTYKTANRVLTLDTLYKIGQRIEVIYDINNPGDCRINTFEELYGAWLYFIALGTGLILTTLFFRKRISKTLA